MVKKDLLTWSNGARAILRWNMSLLLVFTTILLSSGQSQIVCNKNIQISLDEDCRALVNPDMLLEGNMANYGPPFTIRFSGNSVINNNTDAPILTKPGIYSVTVTNAGGNSCWGNVLVEDKLPPIVDCACPVGNEDEDCVFRCTDYDDFLSNHIWYPRPTVKEECGTYTTEIHDNLVVLGPNGCDGKRLVRTWVYTDAYGNTSTCVSHYLFLPVNIDDVTLDPPYLTPSLTCGADPSPEGIMSYYTNFFFNIYKGQIPVVYNNEAEALKFAEKEAAKYAYPTVFGKPITGHFCNLLAGKTDTELPICKPGCGNSKKVIRQWTVLDWCNGGSRTFTQIIHAADKQGPTIVVDPITATVDPWTCASNLQLPHPKILADNCDSNPQYRVEVPFGLSVRYDALTGRFVLLGAIKGIHDITYVGYDCCDNETRITVRVVIEDKTPPIAIAKQHIVISLTSGGDHNGTAKLFTRSVDNGSYDSCTPVHLELRRDTDNCGVSGNTTYNADGHLNDGSSDPTSPNYDNDNGEFVKFCCQDLTEFDGNVAFGNVKVWMRVWDDGDMDGTFGTEGDNYNETWVMVRVEDKLPPQIHCPANVTINCDVDINNTAVTGVAKAYASCANLEVEYRDREYLNSCKLGYVDRTWTIKGRSFPLCVQRITITNSSTPFNPNSIIWPPNVVTNCANNPNYGEPKWTESPCDLIGKNVKSDTFYFEGDACLKILKRWTIIDWCVYNPNSTSSLGYYSYVQEIKVIDDEKPELESCEDLMFANNGNDCTLRNLMLTQKAEDQGQCASDWLKWLVFVDLNSDGVMDFEYSSYLPNSATTFLDRNGNGIPDIYLAPTNNGGEVKITIPRELTGAMGNHKVTWRVSDGCGNSTNCTQNFMVVDKKKPTPYCVNISSALMINGMVELWAVDFNQGSFDNCTRSSNLLYTFDESHPVLSRLNETHFFKGLGLNATESEYLNGIAYKWLPASKSAGKVFNCDDLPEKIILVTVWDEKFNFESCEVRLTLADNQNACGENINGTVSGKVETFDGTKVEAATLKLDNVIDAMKLVTSSSAAGLYSFDNATMYYDYEIVPEKNDDYSNGISTLDLVLIQRHILDISKLNNPYYVIAADINNDRRVTASDLTELRRLILGINTKFSNNKSWKFVEASHIFNDVNHPWPFNERITLANLSKNMENQNFVAVKIGDVNSTAVGKFGDEKIESRTIATLNTQNTILTSNEVTPVNLSLDQNKVFGLQATLSLTNAELVNVEISGKALSSQFIAKHDNNVYTISWNDISSLNTDDIITLHIKSNKDALLSDVLKMNSSITSAEIYSGDDLSVQELQLRISGTQTVQGFEVFQNEPNPFTDKTNIQFYLPSSASASLKVLDVSGKIVHTQTKSFGRGMQSFTVSRNDLPSVGVLFYQIESGDYIATKKMIGLE